MSEFLRVPVMFCVFGLLAALALHPGAGAETAAYGAFLLLGALIIGCTSVPARSPFGLRLLSAAAGAILLAGGAWAFDRSLATTAMLLAMVLFLGRHPFLPLPERPAFILLADLVSGFLLGLLASGRPDHLPAQVGAGHLALAYGGLLVFDGAGRLRQGLGHGFWLAFHILGIGMVGMKFYPLLAFLPFFLGSGTSLYFLLTRQEPTLRTVRTYWGILAVLGVMLLIDRIVRP